MNRLLFNVLLLLPTGVLFAAEEAVKKAPAQLADPVSSSQIIQVISMLLVVIGLIFAFAWFIRRFGQVGLGGKNVIRFIGGIAVGQREKIVLIEVGKEQILIGVAPGRVDKIHVLKEPITITEEQNKVSFAQRLSEVISSQEKQS